ncbi:MAG: G5 domain-containing protein [Actinomycetes bacterium]|nr:G5 domain-containing protein [Actinomycetes bacterium]MDX5380792.1 G5 domain-containing protein [Actinomycetes bacterium]MDX5399833.1 G5 domain-containing protein [Actinomycetes bacterium]MDX5450535.1 G5 domain-containing protein [Actinomycetes bacterium]
MSVTIQRVEVTEVTEQVVDAHETKRVETDSLLEGTEKVTTEGVDGVASHTYRVTMVDGVEVSREILVSAVATERVDEVVSVGTREPAPAPAARPSYSAPVTGPVSPGSNRALGQSMAAARGWTGSQWSCLDALWQRESGWNHLAMNPSSGAYGIPQSLPGSKMATVAADWRTNPATQITWGLNYIAGRYGTPCGAWAHSQAVNWY